MGGPVYKVGDPAPPPLPRRSEAEVMARWQGDKPVVSILCPTYQHVGFIEYALRGFLGQDTDFPFEILVRDDASTDGTAEIVRDYAEQYPNIIRAVLEKENRYPEVKATQVLGPMVRGEFIAVCEGDDYWVASTKLSRQVKLLQKHKSAAASHHDSLIVRDGRIVATHELPNYLRRNVPSAQLLRVGFVPVRTLCLRNPLARRLSCEHVNGDVLLSKSIALSGDLHYVDGPPSAVYRRHEGSWRSRNIQHASQSNRLLQIAISKSALANCLTREGEVAAARYWQRRAVLALVRANATPLRALLTLPYAAVESLCARLRNRHGGAPREMV